MAEDWITALKAVVDRLGNLSRDLTTLRTELRDLALAVLRATEERGPGEEPPAESPAPAEVAPSPAVTKVPLPEKPVLAAPEPESEPEEPQRRRPVPEPVSSPPFPRAPANFWTPPRDEDLSLIEARCRLKAEAIRWCLIRQKMIREGTSRSLIEPRDQEIIQKAKELPDCYLWMIHFQDYSPENLAWHGNLAGCFDTVAAAVALMRDILAETENGRDVFERCLNLVAEAQSALWRGIQTIDGPTDPDQKKIYEWLRARAAERHIFIARFMRAEDRADPARWEDLYQRIEALGQELLNIRKKEQYRKKMLGKIRYEIKVLSSAIVVSPERWRGLADVVDTLVKDGLPPSNRELRDLLLPVYEVIPDLEDIPAGFQMVLREVDRFLASRNSESDEPLERELSPQVQQAARLLQGRSLVLIGGNLRPRAKEALQAALGLKELFWVQIDDYQSLETFEPFVARPEVAVVVLAIRWSRHSFGEVQKICDRFGKPLVRLPAGYNPNQVAAQIIAQCSDRLLAQTT